MRQDQEKMILRTNLLPYIACKKHPNRTLYFTQDDARCHTAKSVKTFLEYRNIFLLDFGNVWSILKSIVYAMDNTNVLKLIENILNIWHNGQRIW